MNAVHDDRKLYAEACFDTPLSADPARVKAATRPDDLLDVPGVHLKSIEKSEANKGFPRFFGRLAKYRGAADYTDAEVVVVSSRYSDDEPMIVWTGTVDEYVRMWIVD